ncbi:hypothetical protein P872_23980 [Rhodonellum psychrophilum GCM71 = DSM 17998]|uniref:MOSC domain-containing protein n=2 Tax=Rhodonellum TaxID=336827 RepID=U5C740_9BACT|nr:MULTISPECIES: MOSC N-terminal beta barrel domain-containing protein [Rhodonellum]ERM84771.1 hypothetical protein P872_23980 [Rhodonellum psychrophilum GCM71 = DSM 17998]SDZ11661.1 hypothetical protein SAMN05444412_10641 [Rhodonellum ikkaensis]
MFLKDIYIYPIKSLGGIRLESAMLEEKGFQYDRRWMLVDENGLFCSQRTLPQMALLQVQLEANGLLVNVKTDPNQKIHIPFENSNEEEIRVEIWEDQVVAQVLDAAINEWFSGQLRTKCRLVVMNNKANRRLKPKYAVHNEEVSFADGMPYLIIGQSSLDDLNEKLDIPVPMDRFRPNLVFSGGEAFLEDGWDKIRIGEATFKITKPCARCVMTTIDQNSGIKNKEPLKTLSKYRTVGNNVMFGQNMLLLGGEKVQIGDLITAI